jgi:hypothetical protein
VAFVHRLSHTVRCRQAAVEEGLERKRSGERKKLHITAEINELVRDVFAKKRGVTFRRDTGSCKVASDSVHDIDENWGIKSWFDAAKKAMDFLRGDVERARRNTQAGVGAGGAVAEANGGAHGAEASARSKKLKKEGGGGREENKERKESKRGRSSKAAASHKRPKVEVEEVEVIEEPRRRAPSWEVLPSAPPHPLQRTCSHKAAPLGWGVDEERERDRSQSAPLSHTGNSLGLQLPPAPRQKHTHLNAASNGLQRASAASTAASNGDAVQELTDEREAVLPPPPPVISMQPMIRQGRARDRARTHAHLHTHTHTIHTFTHTHTHTNGHGRTQRVR